MIIWYNSKFGNVITMMTMWGLEKIIMFISVSNNELYDIIQMLLFDHITCLLILVWNIIRVTMTIIYIHTYALIYIHMHNVFHIMIDQVYTIDCVWNLYLVNQLGMI